MRRGSVIYLLPVLLAGWHLGLIPALVAAVAGVLWSGYFFFSPYYAFYLARPNEILNLVLFMVVAVVTSHLANSMKQQTEIARKRENEMSDLYAFSRRLGGGSHRPPRSTSRSRSISPISSSAMSCCSVPAAAAIASPSDGA